MSRVLLYLAVFLLSLSWLNNAWSAPILMTISTENTTSHVQTKAVQAFVDEVSRRSHGQIKVRYYHSARLYRDRDVIAALKQGAVDMAVPGMWQLDRFVPDTGLYMLPMFYGLPRAVHHRVRDGEIGQQVNQSISRTLGVYIPGRWLDLGYANLFFTDKPVAQLSDLKALQIRIAGGVANRDRILAFGATPHIIAWPDLQHALKTHRVDGLLTTYETVRSARLWRVGIQYAYEDMEYFPQYVPMLNKQFWQRLPDDLKKCIVESWDSIVDDERKAALDAQRAARNELLANGVKINVASPQDLELARKHALLRQNAIISETGINPDLVEMATQELATE